MKRLFLCLLGLVALAFLPGCASTGNDEELSSIPWNHPESWEGQGPVGGMMNTY